MNWYHLSNESQIDSPSLLIYKDRVAANIQQMIDLAGIRAYKNLKNNNMGDI